MAHKVITTLEDDLDGSTEGVKTVKFGLWGREYEIDLSEHHQGELAEALAPFTDVARPVGGRSSKPVAAKSAKRTDLAEVRAWAVEHGYSVAERGRVAQSILDAYDAA